MFLRPFGEGDGSLDGFEDEVVREVTRKAEVDRAVDQRLHYQEDVGRPGAAHRGGHRDEAFIRHLELVAERAQQRLGLLAMRRRRLRCRVPDVDTFADLGWCVRHDPDQRRVIEALAKRRGGRPGDDRDHQLLGREALPNFAEHPGHYLGLDTQHHRFAAPGRLGVVGRDVDPVLFAQSVAAVGPRVAGDDRPGGQQLALQDASDDRLRHHPGADHAQRRSLERSHRRIVRSRSRSASASSTAPGFGYAVGLVGPLEKIDRPSLLALVGVGILTIFGIGATLLTGSSRPAANSSTPVGAVTTYVLAIQAVDANRAWAVLAQSGSQPTTGEPPRPVLSEDDFRNQVQSSGQATRPRLRILAVHQSSDTASTQLEVTRASGNPLTGAATQQITLDLARLVNGWRITSDPQPWPFQGDYPEPPPP